MTTQTPSVDDILTDPSTSYWLKNALERALERDAVDAANDAKILSKVLNDRMTKASVQDIKALDKLFASKSIRIILFTLLSAGVGYVLWWKFWPLYLLIA